MSKPNPAEYARIGLMGGTCVGFIVAGIAGATTAAAFISTVGVCMVAGAAIGTGVALMQNDLQNVETPVANDNAVSLRLTPEMIAHGKRIRAALASDPSNAAPGSSAQPVKPVAPKSRKQGVVSGKKSGKPSDQSSKRKPPSPL